MLNTNKHMKHKLFFMLFFALFSCKNEVQETVFQNVTKFTISSPQLDTTRQIWVYLPKDYQNSEKRYPVVYMHDAQNLFDAESSYAGEWKVDEYLDDITKNQSIIIGIEHGDEKRIDELTPFKHEKYGGGKGEAYLSFIKNTLKPHIDITYRTKPEAEHTTIFGASLGGLISFYGALKHPETFGKAGVFSSSFWINPEIYDIVSNTEIPNSSKFYFLVGENEGDSMVPDQQRMVDLLKAKGITQIESQVIKDGEHNEALWSENFGKAYEWLYK